MFAVCKSRSGKEGVYSKEMKQWSSRKIGWLEVYGTLRISVEFDGSSILFVCGNYHCDTSYIMKSCLKRKLWVGCFQWNENRYLESAFRSTQKDLRYLSIFLKISRPVLSLLEIVWVKFKTALHSVSTSRLLRGVTFEATCWNSSLKVPVCLLEKVFLVIIFTPAEHRQQQLP